MLAAGRERVWSNISNDTAGHLMESVDLCFKRFHSPLKSLVLRT